MATYDSRPSPFTQLAAMSEWEYLFSAAGCKDAVDGSGALTTTFDVPGRNIVMAAGNVAIRGQLWRCDASVSVPIPAPSASNRIDRLVLRLTRTAGTSSTVIQPFVITGTPSGTPTLPPLVKTPTGIWDFPICFWTSQSNGSLSAYSDNRGLIMNDTWHLTGSYASGWTASTIYYKMFGDYTAGLGGAISLPSGSVNGVNICNLPKVYVPQTGKAIPIVCAANSTIYGQSPAGGLPYIWIDPGGTIQVGGIPAGITGTWLFIDGTRYSLDY